VTGTRPHERIREAALFDLWATVARRLGRSSFVIEHAELLTLDSYGVLGFACKTADSVATLLSRLSGYVGNYADNVQLHVMTPGSEDIVLQFLRHGSRENLGLRCANESVFAELLRAIRLATGVHICPQRLTFRHHAPSDISAHERFFGCPITWGQTHDSVSFHPSALKTRNLSADDAMSAFFHDYISEQFHSQVTLEEQVFRTISFLLPKGLPTVDQVADILGKNTRTLQRRLTESNLSFFALLDRARYAMALELLTDTHIPVSDVARRLAFGSSAGFGRAFRRWTSMTATEFRQREFGRSLRRPAPPANPFGKGR
jgi:AraC-like DNA-binding protein